MKLLHRPHVIPIRLQADFSFDRCARWLCNCGSHATDFRGGVLLDGKSLGLFNRKTLEYRREQGLHQAISR